MEQPLVDDLPESEIVVTSHRQKRGALIVLRALELEIERDDVQLDFIFNCHYKMTAILKALEDFNENNKPKLVGNHEHPGK